MGKKKKRFTKQQLAIVRRNYAEKAAQEKKTETDRDKFPDKFPFWARFKPNKNRTTLVIDEERVKRKNSDKVDDCFVHREAIHCSDDNKYVLSGDYEEISPNPDTSDRSPMYLKRPHKHPKRMFAPHNKNLTMPEELRQRYDKNNSKKNNNGSDKSE